VPKKKKPPAPPLPLTGKHKSYLRSLAHPLKAVVQIGHQGLTEGVISAMSAALERHELIKVKVTGESEVDASELAPQIEKQTRSQVAQIIGHTIVLYRRHDEKPKIVLPRLKAGKATTPLVAAAFVPAAEEDAADDSDADDGDFEDDEDEDDEDEDEDEDEDDADGEEQ
jgi:RNA-binding protein